MPVVFRYKSYKVFFYSNEGNLREITGNKELIERAWNDHFA
jgi:hypothetical protein